MTGENIKYVNNDGTILENERFGEFIEKAEAFSHFTYHISGSNLMVLDIQGLAPPPPPPPPRFLAINNCAPFPKCGMYTRSNLIPFETLLDSENARASGTPPLDPAGGSKRPPDTQFHLCPFY